MCIAPVRSAMDSMCKENLGISSFFDTRHNQRWLPYPFLRRKAQNSMLDRHSITCARSCIRADIFDPSTGKILKQVPNLFIERPDPPATETEI